MIKTLKASFLLLVLMFLISGCNLPATEPVISSELPHEILTEVAATILAQKLVTDTPVSPTNVTDFPVASTEIQSSTVQPTLNNTPSPTLSPTATPSPTYTATATFTPSQPPDAYYTDDFSNSNLWYVSEEEKFGFRYKDETYHIYNNILNAAIWSIREEEKKNIKIEVDGTRVAGPIDGYYGVVCRFSDDGDNYYALVVGDDGFYGIALMKDGEFEFLVQGEDTAGIIHRGEKAKNRVAGVCNGDQLSLFANGQLLVEVTDKTLTSGVIGLVVGNKLSGVGTEVSFDNLALYNP